MRSQTRELATDVRQALLALPDDNLHETVTSWLQFLVSRTERSELSDDIFENLGCILLSSERDQTEPEAGKDVTLVFPDAPILRERLDHMPLKQFYHQVIGLAGKVFQEKPWTHYWGEPPSQQDSGASFMTSLAFYLSFKKGAATLSTEQFEVWYQKMLGIEEQEEYIEEEENERDSGEISTYGGRQVHFRIEFTPASKTRSHLLAECLQRYDCTVARSDESGSTLEAYLAYAPWRKADLKALSRARRLLRRWQREETISWSEWKTKPPKHHSRHRRRKTTFNPTGKEHT